MKNSFIRALTLGIAIAFPATVFAQAAGGEAPAAEKKEKKASKKEGAKEGEAGAAPTEGTKTTKKSKKKKAADNGAGTEAAPKP